MATAAICTKCGLDIPTKECYKRPECQSCKVQKKRFFTQDKLKAVQDYEARELLKARRRLEIWQGYIARVPKNYHTLTEEEWQKAVKHFDGKCGFCQEKEYVARGLFLTIDMGGRYCNWNVIPICGDCMRRPTHTKNPFRFMHTARMGGSSVTRKRAYNIKKLKKIMELLEPNILEAIGLNKTDSQQE